MKLRIKEICKLNGITLTELSDRSGIKREALSLYVPGDDDQITGNPTLKTLTKIAEALNVPVTDLFDVPMNYQQITGAVRIGDNVRLIDSVSDIEDLLDELKGS